jgi:hypothetical protein
MSSAFNPTLASGMTSSSVSNKMVSGPRPVGIPAPIPVDHDPPKVSVRSTGMPVNHFAAPQALPHMIHPARGFGTPKVGM